MSTDSQLFNIYVLLQDLMKEHVNIDQCLKETPPGEIDLQKIATYAKLIVERCDEIQSTVSSPCCTCHK